MPHKIPFNSPEFIGKEQEYISDAIARRWASGDGFYTKSCHSLLEKELAVAKVLLTTSCTHALEMSAILTNIADGDEVIVPSFTFVSTVNAFVLRGAKPVFADIRADTLNIDESKLETLITPRTRAIVPVHYAGVGCEMDAISALAESRQISVIEDNAHGLFAKYRGRFLGTFGCMATQSFHETKNFQCGEGGALLINDQSLVERAEIIREKGTNRSKFFRGQIDKYSWVDLGSSYLPSDILAAYLLAQLENKERICAKRREIWTRYDSELREWAEKNGVHTPTVPAHCEQPYHMFYLILPSLEDRTKFIAELDERGIGAVYHYLPLHISGMGRRFGGQAGDCPVTEALSDRLVRLPFFFGLTDDQQAYVIKAVQSFKPGARSSIESQLLVGHS